MGVWTSLIKTVTGAVMPTDSDDYVPIRSLPQKKTRWGFSKVIASGVDSDFGTTLLAGSGQTVAQSGGVLVITSGTTAYAETILRGKDSVLDCFTYRWSTVLSQRIVNQSFVIELVDVVGNNLNYVINSTTSVTVTIPNNPFTSANIGQKMSWVPTAASAGTSYVMEGTIASVSGNNVTFSFASSVGAASGSGTCYLFGWNYHRITYDGTSVTTNKYQTQRNGWPGTANTITMSTTASPGHIAIYNVEDNIATLADQLRATSPANVNTYRAQSFQDMPDGNLPLVFQIRVRNDGTPASTSTLTVAFLDFELYTPQQVSLTSTRPQNPSGTLNTQVLNTVATSPFLSSASTVATAYALTTAATTNLVSIKISRAFLAELTIFNSSAATIYVKFYNKASAPTLASDVPLFVIPIAAGAFFTQSFGPVGKMFSTGLAMAITAAVGNTDTTAIAAGVLVSATYA